MDPTTPGKKPKRSSVEETLARHEREAQRFERVKEYGMGRERLAEAIAKRELELVREKERLRQQRKLEAEREKAERKAAKLREEQLLNIIPSAYSGSAGSMEQFRQKQVQDVVKQFPAEPSGQSKFLYNLKPLKPSMLDLQAKEKEKRELSDRIKAGQRGMPFVPVYNMG